MCGRTDRVYDSAHWTYATDEWSRYIKRELARARKYFFLVFISIIVAVFALTLPGLSKSSLRGTNSFLVVLIIVGIVGVLLWIGLYAPIRAARKRAQGDVYISPRGVLLNDRYYTWMMFGSSGSPDVSYEAGDPSIVEFRWTISGGSNVNFREIRVSVPRAHEHEVQHLLARFKV